MTPELRAEWYQQTWDAMGTRISLTLWAEDHKQADIGFQSARSEFERLNRVMSVYDEGAEAFQLNLPEKKNKAHRISNELYDVIHKALEFSRLTEGAFDITFESVGYQYQLRQHKKPSEKQISRLLPNVDYRQVNLNNRDRTITLSGEQTRINLGGIGKGYAVDKVVSLLSAQGFKHVSLSAGGDTRLLGDHRGRDWWVGIQDPRNNKKMVLTIPLTNEAISTSGDYERFFIDENGERIHHILSPQTGKPAQGLQSVSIIGPDATSTDALSTSVFVMGLDRGMALIERLPKFEAVVIDSVHQVHYTSGLRQPGQSRH